MFTTRPELLGTFGMVASTHWLASQVGMAVLEDGGNAFDAAVAAGLVLSVVEPHLNGPLGEAPIIAHSVQRNETFVVDGQGRAPAGATIERFRDLGLDVIPGTGLLAACVPGAFAAWLALLQRYGTMRVAQVLQYAITYAEDGFPLLPQMCATIASVEQLFTDHWTDSAALYLAGGSVPPPGTRLRNLPWPPRCDGWSRKPKLRAPTGTPRSRRPGVRSTRASSPRRLPPSWRGVRRWTPPDDRTAGCSARRT